ncbi:ABC transporter ATP-binding protein [Lachnobacterium bovis]|uniref:ABC-2 type transport system ATP-binding protein n=1 Tax=Lachnobacterium bovis DSM 14045 TaxID=1122142 RepID=A0A1H3IVV1_9FIRM|nr:ABC transporter ATP-binding protein [Lachnobacterium bovis]SDY31455.1 ABC-2 type transport system ATP-binding protein [Lachnobacterium bovis DSM 14045]
MDILNVSHVAKKFGAKEVLSDVNFAVPEKCIFGLVGRNGAGKTTLMKSILGLLPFDKGKITVCGREVSYKKKTLGDIGYLPDVPEFYGYMTAYEYLSLCGKVAGMSHKEIDIRSEELLELVGLKNEKSHIKGFSRGMKQRLGVAQAIYCKPKLVIFDEPTSALDPVGRKEVLDIISEVGKKSAVIFSTHILKDVERICDRVAFLEQGNIALAGTIEEIKKVGHRSQLEVTLENNDDISRILAAFPESIGKGNKIIFNNTTETYAQTVLEFIVKNKISIIKYEVSEPTLESLFMEVVEK